MKEKNRLDQFENLIQSVVNSVNPEWTDIEKMRAVYIGICKGVTKDVNFFYVLANPDPSTDNYEYIKRSYNIENTKDSNLVICKTMAVILKDALKRLGIKSKLMQTTEAETFDDGVNKIDVHHWFLNATDRDGKHYFMTPVNDLANIQLGYYTNHFGTSVTYRGDGGKKFYKGERFHCTILSKKELYEIDKKIGYVKPIYSHDENGKLVISGYTNYHIDDFEILKHYVNTNGYTKLLCEETKFFQKVFFFKYHGLSCDLREIPNSIIDDNVKNAWLDDLWSRLEPELNELAEHKQYELKAQFNSLRKAILKENWHKSVKRIIYKMSEAFVNEDYLMINKDMYSTDYIIHKFKLFFPFIMSVDNNLVTKELNGINEQVVITEKIIKIIFSELNKNNCLPTTLINEDVGAIMSRIERFNIKNKKTNEYAMIFIIDNNVNHFFFFNPNNGEFQESNDIIGLLTEYQYFSNRLNRKLHQIEYQALKKM